METTRYSCLFAVASRAYQYFNDVPLRACRRDERSVTRLGLSRDNDTKVPLITDTLTNYTTTPREVHCLAVLTLRPHKCERGLRRE
ncbi:hypothetical protein EVAR_72088_1 [Eumeta japonica]|uniref:Uncharacterized protein n=1 Tax=Eumeta variegata TaxID=151549 RepID=A0A4C1S9T0_EUMVA|nr:hypothetical protein EVAR_72088_1 [Eumeta japonica]